jgi:hypothetical protein
VNLPKLPKGTQVNIRQQEDDRVMMEFELPNSFGGSNLHLFDITKMWAEMVEDLLNAEDAVDQALGEPESPQHNSVEWFTKLSQEFIERKKPKLAMTALDGLLREIMEGPDEQVLEGLRAYQALWNEVKALESEIAGNN